MPQVSLAPLLQLNAVWKSYGGTVAVRGVNIALRGGSVHALLGHNGAGKSTLLKIMSGIERPDAGWSLAVRGGNVAPDGWSPAVAYGFGVRVVHQTPTVFPHLSIAENLALARGLGPYASRVHWREVRERAVYALARLDLGHDPAMPMGELRSSDQTMVAVASALQDLDASDASVLLMDEPTASLPSDESTRVLDAIEALAAQGHAVVLITHRMNDVVRVADEATVLRDGEVVAAMPADGVDERAWVQLMIGHDPATSPAWDHQPEDGTDVLLEVAGLSTPRLRRIDLEVRRGEIVGVAGLMGSGRSNLLRALFGLEHRSGEVRLGGVVIGPTPRQAMAAGLALVPEDRGRDAAFALLDVRENICAADVGRYWRRGRIRAADERRATNGSLRSLGIRAVPDQTFETLSGGNQQKAVLARWLRRTPALLLLDEPTQGVDPAARADIHQIVRRTVGAGAAALVVSSDAQELIELCDRVLVMVDGTAVANVRSADLTIAALESLTFGIKEPA